MRNNVIKLTLVIFFVTSIVLFFSLYPHKHAYEKAPAGYTFSGQATWFDPWDINVYAAAIRWGQYRGLLMENMYDSQPNKPIVYYPLYTSLGSLFPSQNPFILFYGLSAITSILLVAVIAYSSSKIADRWVIVFIITLTAVLAGGLGFLAYPHLASLDSSMTSFTFHSAFQRPHEGLALAAQIAALLGFYQFINKTKQKKWAAITVFSLAVTLFFYPYYLLNIFAICFSYLFFFKKKITKNQRFFLLTIFIFGSLVALLMRFNLSQNTSFSGVINQKLAKPTISSLIFGYGFFLIPFGYYLARIKKITKLVQFLAIWISINILLSFLPVGFSRFFLRANFLPLVLLMALFLKQLSSKMLSDNSSNLYISLLLSVLFISSMTNLNIFYQRLLEVKNNNSWYYLSSSDWNAIEFVNSNLPNSSVFLSGWKMGNIIPAQTNQRVFFGHLIQTPNAQERQKSLAFFYAQEIQENALYEFLLINNVDYVYYGPEEKKLGLLMSQKNKIPNEFEKFIFLDEIYKKNDTSIFKFIKQ